MLFVLSHAIIMTIFHSICQVHLKIHGCTFLGPKFGRLGSFGRESNFFWERHIFHIFNFCSLMVPYDHTKLSDNLSGS